MESPTAKLNAYLLQHQAGKMEHKHYNFTSRSSSYSNSWLQDVLTMPNVPRLSDTYKPGQHDTYKPQHRETFKEPVYKDECDYKEQPSTTTLDLVQADPTTGKYKGLLSPRAVPQCDSDCKHDEASIRQYNELMRHEDISLRREDPGYRLHEEASYCQCECRADTPDWVQGLMEDHDMTRSMLLPDLTRSMLLPDNYSLIETTVSKSSSKRKKRKGKEQGELNTPQVQLRVPPTPDTANVMMLLQRAMKQLNEVKQAVEDTSVSAITNDMVTDSTHTFAGLSAMSSLEKFTTEPEPSVTEGEDTLELVQADPTGRT